MRLVTASAIALLVATPIFAQEPQVQEREREHVVRRGDTLWDLAGRYFANPFQWRLIHQANTRVVADPHWIYPEQVLVIPGLREMVEVAPDAVGTPVAGVPATAPAAYRPAAAPPPRTVFYREPPVRREDQPTVLADPIAERVPVKPAEFHGAEYLAVPRALPVVARVVRLERDAGRGGEQLASAHPHDDLFLAYEAAEAPSVGDRLVIVEVGRQVRPAGRDVRVIDPRAIVRVTELEREVMRVTIEELYGRVALDHLALPMAFYPDFLAPVAERVSGEHDLEGHIIVFADDSPLPNRMARAFINLGGGHGVQVGDVFEAYVPERAPRGRGERLPEESVAELRVVRVTDTTATVVVDEIATLHLEPGIPVRRVRKMP